MNTLFKTKPGDWLMKSFARAYAKFLCVQGQGQFGKVTDKEDDDIVSMLCMGGEL